MNDKKMSQKKDYLEKVKLFTNFHDEKVQSYITLIFTFASFIFFGLFAINPTLGTIATLRRELDDTNTVDKQLDEKINDLSTLQQLYSTMRPDIPLLLSAIPQKPEAPRFLAQVQRLADETNVTLTTLTADEVSLKSEGASTDNPVSYTFELSGEGTQEQLQSFYTSISHMIRISTFDTLSLSFSPEKSNYVLNLKGKLYFKL